MVLDFDIRKKSMQDSEVWLLWWKVGRLVEQTVRENAEQKLENIFLLLDVDFSEQFESAPITIGSSLVLFSLRKFDR